MGCKINTLFWHINHKFSNTATVYQKQLANITFINKSHPFHWKQNMRQHQFLQGITRTVNALKRDTEQVRLHLTFRSPHRIKVCFWFTWEQRLNFSKVNKLHHNNKKVFIIEKGSYLPWEQGHLLAAIQIALKFQMASFPLKVINLR